MAARVFDTPTPPSQSYSALQTSLRPNHPVTSTVLPKSRLNQQVYTSASASAQQQDGMSESSFTSTDFGRPEGVQQQQRAPQPTYNKSVGFGDAGMGLGMDDRERFADLYKINNNRARDTAATTGTGGRTKRTRVDEYSDVSLDTSDAEEQSNTTASEDDEFSARLAGRNNNYQQQQRNTSTPFPNHNNNNQSKSAFDGMARELRKEFERIMDSGKAARTYGAHSNNVNENIPPPPHSSSTISPSAAQRRYSLQQPPLNVAPAAIPPLPRGVVPRRSPVKASERPVYERKDSTPTAMRTFGQELPIYRQASQQQARTSFADANPSPKQQQQNKHSLSPFQVLSSEGIQPPNNTRATSHQSIFSQAPLPPVSSTGLIDSPDRQSIPSSYSPLRVPDITGLTDGLSSPSRATSNPSSHRVLANTLGLSPRHHAKSGSRSVEGA